MGHSINVQMTMPEAKVIQRLGRTMYKDDSLGINQSVLVVLRALASGEYILVKANIDIEKPKKAKPEKNEEE